jgi:hypothetical protein
MMKNGVPQFKVHSHVKIQGRGAFVIGDVIGGTFRSGMQRFDIGVFPWHGWVELSFQCEDELDLPNAIADWKHYNFSKIQEGKWPESEHLCTAMLKIWQQDASKTEEFFRAAGDAAKSNAFVSSLNKIFLQKPIEVTVLNPDMKRSRNYALAFRDIRDIRDRNK